MKNEMRECFLLAGTVALVFWAVSPLLAAESQQADVAEYQVPVPAGLSSFSKFQMPVRFEKQGSSVSLQYVLPIELTGVSGQTLTFQGPDAEPHLQLIGQNGTADCIKSVKSLICQVKMQNLETDPAARMQAIKAKSTSSSELQARLQVAGIFSNDPVGVVIYYY